jgi:flavin reductase (DIM6/NTAB) family NADH-FMN oxidoreductase RutF
MAGTGRVSKKYIPSGVSVIGSVKGEIVNAMTAAWVCRASIDPPLVMVGIGFTRRSYPLIKESGVYTINVLQEGQIDVARHFGRTPEFGIDKFEEYPFEIGETGAPILKECLAFMECEVVSSFVTGDHEWFVGRIQREGTKGEGNPLVYRSSDYR